MLFGPLFFMVTFHYLLHTLYSIISTYIHHLVEKNTVKIKIKILTLSPDNVWHCLGLLSLSLPSRNPLCTFNEPFHRFMAMVKPKYNNK